MTGRTADLLAGRPGVYRVLDRPDLVVSALTASGWRTATVGPTRSRHTFYGQIAESLSFPAYFGANLDALWDSLTELSAPTALVLVEWTTLARARPDGWRRILEVFVERTQTAPPFAVVLA